MEMSLNLTVSSHSSSITASIVNSSCITSASLSSCPPVRSWYIPLAVLSVSPPCLGPSEVPAVLWLHCKVCFLGWMGPGSSLNGTVGRSQAKPSCLQMSESMSTTLSASCFSSASIINHISLNFLLSAAAKCLHEVKRGWRRKERGGDEKIQAQEVSCCTVCQCYFWWLTWFSSVCVHTAGGCVCSPRTENGSSFETLSPVWHTDTKDFLTLSAG